MTRSALIHVLRTAALGAALAAAPAAFAHDHDNEEKNRGGEKEKAAEQRSSVQGTVAAVSPRSLTLAEGGGRTVKVELDQETTYENGNKTGAVSELRPGMTVSVRGAKQKDGTIRAETVRYDQASARPGAQPN